MCAHGVLNLECITAINVSVQDQLTLSISVAVGSTIVRLHVPIAKCGRMLTRRGL